MKQKLYQSLIELTNGKSSSMLLKTFAQSKWSAKLIPSYTKLYGIEIAEVAKTMPEFTSLHDFFTRQLLQEARPIVADQHVFVSPVDAKMESFGAITDNMQFTVKGKIYSIENLLGSAERAKRYRNGQFIVFYLSPADYHRIHSPVDGTVIRQYILGNKSFPVNQLGLTYGKKPISHNYRLITELKLVNDKQFAFVKVGATFVNSIVLSNASTTWKKGEEVGYFSFGSTVVMLFEKDTAVFTEKVVQGNHIRMGEAFANML